MTPAPGVVSSWKIFGVSFFAQSIDKYTSKSLITSFIDFSGTFKVAFLLIDIDTDAITYFKNNEISISGNVKS